MVCTLFLGGSSVDLIRCPGFSRMEVGERPGRKAVEAESFKLHKDLLAEARAEGKLCWRSDAPLSACIVLVCRSLGTKFGALSHTLPSADSVCSGRLCEVGKLAGHDQPWGYWS